MGDDVSRIQLSSTPAGNRRHGGGRRQRSGDATSNTGGGSVAWLAALGKRALSAFILIPLVIALVWFGGWVAFAGALCAVAICAWELHDMFAHKGWHPPILLSAALCVDFLATAVLWHTGTPVLLLALAVLLGISLLLGVSFAWLLLTRHTLDAAIVDWALAMAVPFYLGLPLAFFLLLRGDTPGTSTPGFAWLLALFFMVWANDTFALLSGHYFGRHKLSPRISPAKTWEGFWGGLVFTVIAALIFLILIPNVFSLPLHVIWYHAVAIGILTCVAATIGDLAESLLKRGTGVKDSGKIVPGHGGLLDRVDSLLFAVLVVVFYAAFLHGIPM